jgi:hypothetical protein
MTACERIERDELINTNINTAWMQRIVWCVKDALLKNNVSLISLRIFQSVDHSFIFLTEEL